MNGLDGSIESTPTVRSRSRSSAVIAPISVLLPTPGGPVTPTIRARPVRWEELGDELVALRVAVLDQADGPRQRAALAREHPLGERRGGRCLGFGHEG